MKPVPISAALCDRLVGMLLHLDGLCNDAEVKAACQRTIDELRKAQGPKR